MINYDKEMHKVISSLKSSGGEKPKLLLHACCAPCSSASIERLIGDFDITVYFFNPNIDTEKEYLLRTEEEKRFCLNFSVPVVVEDYDSSLFYDMVKGYEDAAEGGERCFICYKLRLDASAKYAKEHGFDFFTTTLTISPLKNAAKLNELGFAAQKEYDIKFLPSDFKKRNGYLRSIELSKEYGLYRQNYCGCAFSKNKTPQNG